MRRSLSPYRASFENPGDAATGWRLEHRDGYLALQLLGGDYDHDPDDHRSDVGDYRSGPLTLAENCIVVVRKAGQQVDGLLEGFDSSYIDPILTTKLLDQLYEVIDAGESV